MRDLVLVTTGLILGTGVTFVLLQVRRLQRRLEAAERVRELASRPPEPEPPPPGRPQLKVIKGGMAAAVAAVAWVEQHRAASLVALAGIAGAVAGLLLWINPEESGVREPPYAAPSGPTLRPSIPSPLEPSSVAPTPSTSEPDNGPDPGTVSMQFPTALPPAEIPPQEQDTGPNNRTDTQPDNGAPEPEPDERQEPETDEPPPPPPEPDCSIIHIDLQPTAEACILPDGTVLDGVA